MTPEKQTRQKTCHAASDRRKAGKTSSLLTSPPPATMNSTPVFAGFPTKTLLESDGLPIEALAELALREGQATSPLYRVHRWFARRLGSQFRAMLAALSLSEEETCFWDRYFGEIPLRSAVVLDPFVGGGTSLTEASRCQAKVIGYDIDPVATLITRFELECAGWPDLPASAKAICAEVADRILPFHRTTLGDGREADVIHHFWVEVTICRTCEQEFEVHPHFLLAYNRAKKVQWAFCRQCHEVHELPIEKQEFICNCGTQTQVGAGPLSQGKLTCPSCRAVQDLATRGRETGVPPRWRLFAQEYLDPTERRSIRRFKAVTDEDEACFRRAARLLSHLEREKGAFAPDRAIPVRGRSDQRPLIHGFRRYGELFNPRQLLHLTMLGRAIRKVRTEKERRLLALAFSEHLTTNCMYSAYAFGYRRISPMFSIHGYRHITRPVELNPWLERVGRGTFPNVLGKIGKAIRFAKAPSDLDPDGGRKPSTQPVGPSNGVVGTLPDKVLHNSMHAAIRTHDSADLSELPDGSVDLVLSDPPYFDNVSYSELSDFYLAWLQKLGVMDPPYDKRRCAPLRENLAVRDKTPEAIRAYRDNLARILTECYRVLRPRGVFVFTYHHRSPKAWSGLGEALVKSGFRCSAVVPMRGEGQGGLHSFDGTIKWDAVLVCRKGRREPFKKSGTVVVSKEAVAEALEKTRGCAERLSKHERIGFGPPDQINLFRAFIVASAFDGTLRDDRLTLEEAVRQELDLIKGSARAATR